MTTESKSNYYKVSITILGAFCFLLALLKLNTSVLTLKFALFLLIATLIAPRMSIALPRSKFILSFGDSIIFLTFLLFGGEAAIVIAAVETLANTLYFKFKGFEIKRLMILFNIGLASLSTGITYWVWSWIPTILNIDPTSYITTSLITTLGILAFTQFISLSVFASIFYSLKTPIDIWQAWKKEGLPTSLTLFAGAGLAGIIFKLLNYADLYSITISLIAFAVIYYNYKQIIGEMTSSIEQMEQAERDKAKAEQDKAKTEREKRIEIEKYAAELEKSLKETEKYAKELAISLQKEEETARALRKSQEDVKKAERARADAEREKAKAERERADIERDKAKAERKKRIEIQKYADELAVTLKRKEKLISVEFKFPEEVKVAAEKYLLYFVKFLEDLGVSATSDIEHNAKKTLFSVTPNNENEALDKIREALATYLNLPSSPLIYNNSFASMRLQQEIDNLQHAQRMAVRELQFNTQLLDKQSQTIEEKNITIAQLQFSNEQQQKIIEKILSKSIMIDSVEKKEELEEIYDGVSVGESESLKKWLGITINPSKVIETTVSNPFSKDDKKKALLALEDELGDV